jgi:hypothetical protein
MYPQTVGVSTVVHLGTLGSLLAALAASSVAFAASLAVGVAWLFIAARSHADDQTAVGIDLPIYVKHVSIPISVVVFITVLAAMVWKQ